MVLSLESVKKAKEKGITVSCDLNYRRKLWSKEKAQSVMRPLMQYVDVCIGNEEDAQAVLGLTNDADVENAQTDSSRYEEMFKKMKVEFGFKVVATTLRESYSASNNGWKACLYDGFLFYNSKRYEINPIVDRVGGGDSFSAGLIHGLLELNDKQKAELDLIKQNLIKEGKDPLTTGLNGTTCGGIMRCPSAAFASLLLERGKKLTDGLVAAGKNNGFDLVVSGEPSLFYLRIANDNTMMLHQEWIAECVKRGVFFAGHHNHFMNYAMSDADFKHTWEVADEAFKVVAKNHPELF